MKFLHLTETGSTNDEVRRLAEQGEIGPLWLSADVQTGGRGRHGRNWTSDKGNLYASGLFPLDKEPLAAAQLGFAAALAIADTIAVYAPGSQVTLKWPNDVLVDGAKISGILLETGQTQGRSWVIVGIGLNLLSHPADTPYPATHLLEHISKAALSSAEPIFTGVEAVLPVLSSRFEHWRVQHAREGFAALRNPWLAMTQGVNEMANIRLANRSFRAKIIGLGGNGELQVEHSNGTIESLYAGDVFPNAPLTEN